MNKVNSVKRSRADRQQLKDLTVPAANLDGYFTHTEFSAKKIVLKNSKMADNHKSMARTREISICLVLQTTVTQHIQTGSW